MALSWLRQILPFLTLASVLLYCRVLACLESDVAYYDVSTGASTFDDLDFLNENFRDGMTIDTIEICQADISGNSYIVGIQINLVHRTDSTYVEGNYHGLTQADLPGSTVTCPSPVRFTGTVTDLLIGSRTSPYDSSIYVLTFARISDDLGNEGTWGTFFDANGGIKRYSFDVVNGGMIGLYGSYTDTIHALGPYYNPGLCTCQDTEIISSQTIDSMVAVLNSGDLTTQAIPTFENTYERQGRGSCGGQLYSVQQTDGSSCSDFLTVVDGELRLQSTNTALAGEYQIRLTIVMEDYLTVQATTDFSVLLIELGSGPTYVSSQAFKVAEGPYTVANTCYYAPTSLGYTLNLSMVTNEASLPSYYTYDASAVAITLDPQSNSLVGDQFTVTFQCYLTELPANVHQESVTITVTENEDNPDCPDPYDLTDVTCCVDPSDTTDVTCCPDPFNTADPNCPEICPDPFDLTDSTCCVDPTDATDSTCCPDPFNTADSNCPGICVDPYDLTDVTCCVDPTDTTDTTCCPDPFNTADTNCPGICIDPFDLTDVTCCVDPSDTTDSTCCPDPFNTADTNCPGICIDPFDLTDPTCCVDPTDATDSTCCPDPFNTADSNCPGICVDPYDLTDVTCCVDPSDTSDVTCCPDPFNSADPNCPEICPDPFDLTDATCCVDPTNTNDATCCPDPFNTDDTNCPGICIDPYDLTDVTCCVDPTDETDPTCCPDPSNTADSNCPQICPDPYDLTDVTCCVDPTDLSDPTCISTVEEECPDSTNPECDDYIEPVIVVEEVEIEWHDYYIKTGDGPILRDYFSSGETLTTYFTLVGVEQGLDWTYKYSNQDPVDEQFIDYWGEENDVEVQAFVQCGQVSFFVDCYHYESQKVIYLASEGFQDAALYGQTFEMTVSLLNEISQWTNQTISFALLEPYDPDAESQEEDQSIQVEDLDAIESIVVEYGLMGLKGNMTLHFSEYVFYAGSDSRRLSDKIVSDSISEQLTLDLRLDEDLNGLDPEVTRFTYEVVAASNDTVKVQLDFDCPQCISSFEIDTITVEGRQGDRVLFSYDVEVPPQVPRDYWLTDLIEFAAFITVYVMAGTVGLALLLDLIYFHSWQQNALWQAVEIWQQVCYVQLLAVPLPGYALLYTPELMPAVNFDVLHFLEKYWREVPVFEYVNNEHLLGVNFVTFGFDSIHFAANVRSSLGMTLALLAVFFLFAWRLPKKSSRNFMASAIYVLLKSIAFMVFTISALIQLEYNGDDGAQTAGAILTLCFLGLVLPVGVIVDECKRKQWPSRQFLTVFLRGATCATIFYLTDYPDYQFIVLEALHVIFALVMAARFKRHQTGRSLGITYSYGLMPILIFSLRFDESGICPVCLTALVLIASSGVHVWWRDWVYKVYLYRLRKQYRKKVRAAMERKRLKAAKEAQKLAILENQEESDSEERDLSALVQHDFQPESPKQQHQLHVPETKLILPLVVKGAIGKNQVVPIMEVPSSESGHSSKLESPRPNHRQSVHSQESYGFKPREHALLRTISAREGDLLTSTGLVMLTTETGGHERVASQDHVGTMGNFDNGQGRISAIDFHGKDREVDLSFNGSEDGEGLRRSNFNEDLLNSSGSFKAAKKNVVPSGEFELKSPKTPFLTKDLDISIDIEWPAERIEAEYRKQQTQKMQLLFGPNWEYQGEALDIDKAKKEIFKWKRDEEKQRSMVLAQEPSIVDSQRGLNGEAKEKNPAIQQWAEEIKAAKERSPKRTRLGYMSGSIEKDSLIQSIMRGNDYQSVPVNESILSRKDPLGRLPHHQRINTASLDFYLSNQDNMPEEARKQFDAEETQNDMMDARELQLFSRNKKKRKQTN